MQENASGKRAVVSRLGFLLMSAGCAIGLGNVWRFPYITGASGGAIFVGIYLVFLLAVLPILVMEFAIGRAARQNLGSALAKLEPAGTRWHLFRWLPLAGSYLLMMFYSVVTGWMILYCWYMGAGRLSGLAPDAVGAFFGATLGDASVQVLGMTLSLLIGFGVCAMGVVRGVERVVKVMMGGLFLIMIMLAINSLLLPGAEKGVAFYLAPDWSKIHEVGFLNVCNAAMNQAFFTLSVGIGSMTIFGSYQSRRHSLGNEAIWIMALDTFVAFTAGLIIFPACFAFNVQPGGGPGLIFSTLPNIFNAMAGGRFWGMLFFVFMAFASLSTVITVLENVISYSADVWGIPRKRATVLHTICLWLLSLPCALGFNNWASFQPFGEGSCVLDLEDFIVSNNLLPLGGLMILLFCCHKFGWGWDNFVNEVDQGQGLRFPRWLRG